LDGSEVERFVRWRGWGQGFSEYFAFRLLARRLQERLMSRERYKQSVLVSTDVRSGRVGHPWVTPTGFAFILFYFPTASAVGYVVSSLRDFRRKAGSLHCGSCCKRLAAK
jgi:hypothetical protein